ncbi:MAG: NrfD/PsrC family molybdoenzyme membrane anchor subunit [Gammaproteobacteria bacterium]|nr:NrfD/PsrC family molybdoenzyme membrane anchor subunit [Gammaproteobacteria bacterium]
MTSSTLPNEALVNYIFPNTHIDWSLMIVIYPYITGLVAGAFVVSALYHVFNVKTFERISRFALIAAFCFGLFAGVPLLLHLGQPQRAFNIFLTPNTTSAMSIFGYVYASYMLLLTVELWLTYREYIIQRAKETKGIPGVIWNVLTLGVRTYTPEAARVDHKVTVFLAAIGIPWAFLLHGYVGFIFGSVKANAWWATPLQPIVFLVSAIVSGMAMLLLMYTFIRWRARKAYDLDMIKTMTIYLWCIFLLAFTLETLEVVYAAYEQGHHWTVIGPLLAGPLFDSFVIGQVLTLSVLPILILGYAALSNVWGKPLLYLVNIGAFLLVLQVLFMRFNVVVGGQMLSKSDRGFAEFHLEVLGREGLIMAIIVFAAPFVTYYIISRIIPIFDDQPVRG